MGIKIHSPKNRGKHNRSLIVCQGKCTDSSKVTEKLTDSSGKVIPKIKDLSKGKKNWAFLYSLPGKDTYTLTVTGSAASVTFTADPCVAPPPPAVPPTISAPASGDTVAAVFYPTGTSDPNLAAPTCVFSGNGVSVNGTVTGPDGNGDWSAIVDTTGSGAPDADGYSLTVTNDAGSATVLNLTLSTSEPS